MPLQDGDVAADGDVWFRLITSDSHISRGAIKHGAFTGRFLGKPRSELNRPWANEVSGRLRSIAGSVDEIRQHAEAYCGRRSGQKFAGLMYCRKSDVTKTFDQFSLNVHFTPIVSGPDADQAHADLTISGPTIEIDSPEHERLILELSDIVVGLHSPIQIKALPAAEISEPSPMSPTQQPNKTGILSRLIAALVHILPSRG